MVKRPSWSSVSPFDPGWSLASGRADAAGTTGAYGVGARVGDATVNELLQPFEISQPAISKHLKVLERAGLISRDRDAQRRPSRLEAARLAEASAWLDQYREFWEASFARLDTVLHELTRQKTRRQKPSRRR